MAPRPYWKGYLKLSLVACPVAVFTATTLGFADTEADRIEPGTTGPIAPALATLTTSSSG